MKRALLLEFDPTFDYEGLTWRFAIATVRYAEERFDGLTVKQPINANVRYIPASAVDLPDPFRPEWIEDSRFLVATLHLSEK